MPIKVVQVASIVDGEILFDERSPVRPGELVGFLCSLGPHPAADGPAAWTMNVQIRTKPYPQNIPMVPERFLSARQYEQSFVEPISLSAVRNESYGRAPEDERLWLFRDDFYSTMRKPRASEREEIVLRIKALHFQSSDALKRLREQVANFEAVESLSTNRTTRQLIPDDVKLLVWTRDGGRCVKCGASKDLHFDHIIPLSRGGGDQAENIQLLCRTCNLAKSDRLA